LLVSACGQEDKLYYSESDSDLSSEVG